MEPKFQVFFEIFPMNNPLQKPGVNSQVEHKNRNPTWQGVIFGILLCIFLSLILFFIIGFHGTLM